MPYELSPRALSAISQLIRYRRREAGLSIATRLDADLKSAFELIGRHPRIGSRRPDLSRRPYRFWRKGLYWIVYELDERGETSRIVTVIDVRRYVARLLR